jgi:HAD superfamily hydrolase (TIGR01450 family)
VHFNYSKLFKAASYLSKPDIHFVATNDLETSEQISKEHCQPLTGAMVSAVAAAANRKPEVIGKPHYHLMEAILDTHPQIDPKKTLMIGDSLKTDIPFAHRAGISSALVLSGDTSEERLDKLLSLPKSACGRMPNYVLPSVSYLAEFI